MEQTQAPMDSMDPAASTAVPQQPAPTDPMMDKVSSLLRENFERQGWRFSIQEREMAAADIAAPTGLLPIVAYRAAELYEEAMGQPMPLYYYPNPDALCEVSPGVEPGPQNTMIAWGHFVHYAMEEWVKRYPDLLRDNAPIPLDEMYDRWFEAAQSHKLQFRDTLSQRPSAPGRSGGL